MKTVKVIYAVNGQTKSIKSGPVAENAVRATQARLKSKALVSAQAAMGLTEPDEVPTWQSPKADQAAYKAWETAMEAVNNSITFDVAEA